MAKWERYAKENNTDIEITCFSCGEDLVKEYWEKKSPFDIIFLDVEMKVMDGIDTAREIRLTPDHNVLIAYITSYPEYMQKSFDVQASQYLTKPLTYDLFQEKMKKLCELIESLETYIIVVDQKEGETLLNLEEIQYIETVKQISGRGKLEIALIDKNIVITGKLADYEEKLKNQGFARIHRTALVNLRFVYKFKGDTISLKTGKELSLGKRYAKELKGKFSDFIVLKYHR